MKTEHHDHPRGKGIYLIPNLFTLTALFSGFYAIIAAMKGHFDHAAIAIFVAMVMDTLDGRIARLTQTQTAFGAELDSLSDMVSFGIAPALIAYTWGVETLGKAGWLVAFVYTAAVALRLARFNVQTTTTDKRYFKGIPCPAAASVVVSLVWSVFQYDLTNHGIQITVAVITVIISLLMVSKLPYYSFKDFDFKNKVPYMTILFIIFLFVLISVDPPLVWLTLSLGFAGSAPVFWVMRHPKRLQVWRFIKKNKE